MDNILFSVITPVYKTPINKIQRLYNSLVNQTYANWEWIVYDDSPTEHKETYNFIKKLARKDKKIKLHTNNKNIGIIGDVKKKAFSLGQGDVLVEVDHDDELVDTCLENLSIAYQYSDSIGFVYGHACELYENSEEIIDYGNNWAFGYGRYQMSNYKGKEYKVAIVPNINPKTIRYITGIPNHVRSWKKDVYHQIGGHNETLHVADDYELFVRTFLKTRIAKVNAFTYIQYFERDNTNTQFNKNADIQEITYGVSSFFNDKIHEKFVEFGVDDYVWNDGVSDLRIENPETEMYVNIIIPEDLIKSNLIKNNLIEMEDKKNLYGYSRVYNIPATLDYKQTEHYSQLIKWIVRLTNCQSYLELGIEYGYNIQEIKNLVPICVGVDANVTEILNPGNIEFHQMTTDNFFKKNKRKFDIIFIDANHKFEQVKKDFNNALKILNKYGVILLHDTDPIVVELLSENHCHDSYKMIDYISTKKGLNIVTLPIQETGLTIVNRKEDRRVSNFLKNK